VTAVAAGATIPAGESTSTELVVPAGQLEYGSQYAFQVVSVNKRGGASKASPVSNSVVPFTAPEPSPSLDVTVVPEMGTRCTRPCPPGGQRPPHHQVRGGGPTAASVAAGSVTVRATGTVDGEEVTTVYTAEYSGLSCAA
jgi:hypothetical protein